MKLCLNCYDPVNQGDQLCRSCGIRLDVQEKQGFTSMQTQNVGDIRINLGLIYFNMKQYDLAIENLEAIFKQSPDNEPARKICELARQQKANVN